MSDYTTNAIVELNVNGQKAKQELEQQRKLVKDLELAYAKATASGDKSSKTLQKELNKARRELKSMQSAAVNVADVLRRLDSATPKELKSTLRQLNKELNGMERGSMAWNEQAMLSVGSAINTLSQNCAASAPNLVDFVGRPHGYTISRYRREANTLNLIKKIGLWLSGGLFTAGAGIGFVNIVTKWSDGSTSSSDDGTGVIRLLFKVGLFVAAVLVFCTVSCFLMLYATITGLIRNYNWKEIKNKASKKN